MLRGIAALLVVQVHFLNNLILRDVLKTNIITDFFKIWGDFGVDIFFVISGFVMARSLENQQSFWEFFLRRFYRIYPLYFISVIFLLAIHYVANSWDFSTIFLVKTFVLFPTFHHSDISMFLGPAWTLCFELLFYFCCSISFISFFSAIKSRSLIVILALFFFSFIFSNLFLMFLYGIICWKCYKLLPSEIFTTIIIILVLSYIVIIQCIDISLHTQLNSKRWLYFGIPALIIVSISSKLNLRNSFLEYLGEISYSIYLSHMALTVHVYGKLAEVVYMPFIVHFVLIIIISIIVGIIFYELFEKPLLSKLLKVNKK